MQIHASNLTLINRFSEQAEIMLTHASSWSHQFHVSLNNKKSIHQTKVSWLWRRMILVTPWWRITFNETKTVKILVTMRWWIYSVLQEEQLWQNYPKKVKVFTWNSQTIRLLHNEYRTRIWFPVSSHYFSSALASFIIEAKHTPLITKYPEFFVVFRTWMHLCIPLLKPSLHSWPMNFTLQ